MKKCGVIFVILSLVLYLAVPLCLYQGFDYKDNYRNSDDYPSLNKNAYVGGDAYNYIINSNYFTGFTVLGSASCISATILLAFGVLLINKSNDRTMDGMKAIYDKVKIITDDMTNDFDINKTYNEWLYAKQQNEE